jgi:KDO2-lipid IV(A) lauroyltransferase
MIYYLYLLAWRILRFLPASSAYRLGRFAARYAFKKNGKGITRLRSNMSLLTGIVDDGELDKLTLNAVYSYTRYWIDSFLLPNWSVDEIISRVTVINGDYLTDAMAVGKGCIVAIPHSGNWDLAGAYYSCTFSPVVTVAEHLKPEKLFKKFLEFRLDLGMEVLDLESRTVPILSRRLKAGEMVALVADRDITNSGIKVQFGLRLASFPAGPALLSIHTGAPLITAVITYDKTGIVITFGAPIPIPAEVSKDEALNIMIAQTADRLFHELQKKPEDWHMLQRVWVDS